MTVVYCDNKSCKFNLVGEMCQKDKIKVEYVINFNGMYEEKSVCKSEELNELPL
jgi:hypothetical protein